MMWIRWIDSFGAQYPCGWQAIMLRMRELVDGEPDVEYSLTFRLWDLLAPDESEGSKEPMMDDPPEEDQMMNRVGCNPRFTNVCTVSK